MNEIEMKKWRLYTACLLVISACGVVFWRCSENDSRSAVQSIELLLRSGEWERYSRGRELSFVVSVDWESNETIRISKRIQNEVQSKLGISINDSVLWQTEFGRLIDDIWVNLYRGSGVLRVVGFPEKLDGSCIVLTVRPAIYGLRSIPLDDNESYPVRRLFQINHLGGVKVTDDVEIIREEYHYFCKINLSFSVLYASPVGKNREINKEELEFSIDSIAGYVISPFEIKMLD